MVLDTCAVLWLAFNRENISESTLNEIDQCDIVRISTMSFWEIGVKIRKKKIVLPIGFHELVHLYVEDENVKIIPPEMDIVIKSVELGWEHRDPVDRIVIATAMKFDDYIITADSHIERFYRKTKK